MMKVTLNFLRAVKIGLQYIWRNLGLSLASTLVVTLCFLIVSVIALIFGISSLLVQYIDSKPSLVIFLRGDLSEDEAQKFMEIVQATGLAREVHLKDIDYTRQDFARKYKDSEMQELLKDDDIRNFMPRIAFIYGTSQQNLQELIGILEKNEYFMNKLVDENNIDRVGWYNFSADQANLIKETNQLVFNAGLALTLMLLLVTSALIYINIKLAINNHRREIEIMSLVGADWLFIKFPFVIAGMIYGLVGSFLSTTIILIFKLTISQNSAYLMPRLFSFLSEVNWPALNWQNVLLAYALTTAIGLFIGASSSYGAIFRYVKG